MVRKNIDVPYSLWFLNIILIQVYNYYCYDIYMELQLNQTNCYASHQLWCKDILSFGGCMQHEE